MFVRSSTNPPHPQPCTGHLAPVRVSVASAVSRAAPLWLAPSLAMCRNEAPSKKERRRLDRARKMVQPAWSGNSLHSLHSPNPEIVMRGVRRQEGKPVGA